MAYHDDSGVAFPYWPLRRPCQGCSECKTEEMRAFELADCIEKGFAREIEAEFSMPVRRSGQQLWRFHVERSDDRSHFRMFSEDGSFLMYAKASARDWKVDFLLYDPEDEEAQPDDLKPAFTMAGQKDGTEWRLVQERCERCQLSPWSSSCAGHGKQQMAYIRHSQEEVDEEVVNLMEVRLPGVHLDGSRVLWCPLLGRGDLATVAEEDMGYEVRRFVGRLPDWDDEDNLELPFRDREVLASAKNFMLVPESRPDQIVCQHGKLGPSTFALDFRYPMSVVQAFAVCVSTMLFV